MPATHILPKWAQFARCLGCFMWNSRASLSSSCSWMDREEFKIKQKVSFSNILLSWWINHGERVWKAFNKYLFSLQPPQGNFYFSNQMQQPLGSNWFPSWSLQKLTWKSRQADVDTCRMKGKHKVGNFHFSCGCHFGLRFWRLSPAVDYDLNASCYSPCPSNCFFHQLIESFNLQK